MKNLVSAFCVMFVLLAASAAHSQVVLKEKISRASEETSLARPMALGEAYTAIAEGCGGLVYNPAGMSSKVAYSIMAASQFKPTGGEMSFTGSIVDSATTVLAAGLMYTFQQYDYWQFWNDDDLAWLGAHPIYADEGLDVETNYENADEVTGYRRMFGQFKDGLVRRHVARLALGGAITPNVHMGALVKYMYADRPNRHNVNSANIDLGMLFTTDFGLRVGVAGYNLINSAYVNWPLRFAVGVGYSITDELYIDYDQVLVINAYKERLPDDLKYTYDYDDVDPAYRFGIEYIAVRVFSMRAGYQYDDVMSQHFVSGGIAYIHESFTIGASYNQALPDYDDRLMGVEFEFRL